MKKSLATVFTTLTVAWVIWISSGVVESKEKFATISAKLDAIVKGIADLKRYHKIP